MTETESPNALSPRMWALACVGAIALHLCGVALVLDHIRAAEIDDELGATAIEIGFDLLSPRVEVTDLPPGPETDASTESPAVVEQKMVVSESDLPTAVPTETENPDRVVTPDVTKKPTEEEPQVPVVQALASIESVAVEATAMPSSEVMEESTLSTAPVLGSGDSKRKVRATWQKELSVHLERFRRYPPDRSRQAAEIVVSFVLDRTGRVLASNVVRSSGDPSFDAAALDMMSRASPVPPPPPLVADDGLEFTMPVVFRVKGNR